MLLQVQEMKNLRECTNNVIAAEPISWRRPEDVFGEAEVIYPCILRVTASLLITNVLRVARSPQDRKRIRVIIVLVDRFQLQILDLIT